jgi:hypothetical protein
MSLVRRYRIPLAGNVALVGGTAKALFGILCAAGHKIAIAEWNFGGLSSTSADQSMVVTIDDKTGADDGVGGTPVTPKQEDGGLVMAASFTAKRIYTTPPTGLDSGREHPIPPGSPLLMLYPEDEEPTYGPGQLVVVQALSATAVAALRGYVIVKEA